MSNEFSVKRELASSEDYLPFPSEFGTHLLRVDMTAVMAVATSNGLRNDQFPILIQAFKSDLVGVVTSADPVGNDQDYRARLPVLTTNNHNDRDVNVTTQVLPPTMYLIEYLYFYKTHPYEKTDVIEENPTTLALRIKNLRQEYGQYQRLDEQSKSNYAAVSPPIYLFRYTDEDGNLLILRLEEYIRILSGKNEAHVLQTDVLDTIREIDLGISPFSYGQLITIYLDMLKAVKSIDHTHINPFVLTDEHLGIPEITLESPELINLLTTRRLLPQALHSQAPNTERFGEILRDEFRLVSSPEKGMNTRMFYNINRFALILPIIDNYYLERLNIDISTNQELGPQIIDAVYRAFNSQTATALLADDIQVHGQSMQNPYMLLMRAERILALEQIMVPNLLKLGRNLESFAINSGIKEIYSVLFSKLGIDEGSRPPFETFFLNSLREQGFPIIRNQHRTAEFQKPTRRKLGFTKLRKAVTSNTFVRYREHNFLSSLGVILHVARSLKEQSDTSLQQYIDRLTEEEVELIKFAALSLKETLNVPDGFDMSWGRLKEIEQ